MSNKRLMLKDLMRALTDTATYANNMLRRDCAAQMSKIENGKVIMPAPRLLCVAGMRISFTANISDEDRENFRGKGGDIYLDFSGPNGNFRGEIFFNPCETSTDVVCAYDNAAEPTTDETEEYNEEPDNVLEEISPVESFESSEI